jgi:hypothetical protein
MRGELGMTDHLRHRARTPALVGRLELGGRADRKGRNEIEAEGGGVIVEHQEDHIGLLLLLPLFGEVVALEHWLPIGFGGLAEVERSADRWHVRGINAGGDAGHYFFSPVVRLPSIERPPLTIMSRY